MGYETIYCSVCGKKDKMLVPDGAPIVNPLCKKHLFKQMGAGFIGVGFTNLVEQRTGVDLGVFRGTVANRIANVADKAINPENHVNDREIRRQKKNDYSGMLEQADAFFNASAYTQALRLYIDAAKKHNDSYGAYMAGIIYKNGLGVSASYVQAVRCFEKAIDLDTDKGVAKNAYMELADCYGNGGNGLKQDEKKASGYISMAERISLPVATNQAVAIAEDGYPEDFDPFA